MRVCWNLVGLCVMVGAGVAFCDGGAATQPVNAEAGAVEVANVPAAGGQNWFGVAVENIPPQIARQLKLRRDQGLMVMAVLSGSPAESAGMKAGDILIEIDGEALTSQEQLARAANAVVQMAGTETAKVSRLGFLRDGDRREKEITPEPRPANMVVMGGNALNFTVEGGGAGAETQSANEGLGLPTGTERGALPWGMKNFAFPDGQAEGIGPGYRMNVADGDAGAVMEKSIQSIVSKGQTVILSQETDRNGVVKNTMIVGGKTYAVEPGHLENLPAELRPLGERMISSGTGAAGAELEQRVRALEEENRELQGKLSELIDLLKKREAEQAGVAGQGNQAGK